MVLIWKNIKLFIKTINGRLWENGSFKSRRLGNSLNVVSDVVKEMILQQMKANEPSSKSCFSLWHNRKGNSKK